MVRRMGAATPASAESPGTLSPHAMRLLVTNPWNGQAYCVLRSLRRHATRVVATVYREHGALGRLVPAAVSRFVDRVDPVPLAIQDWRRGGLEEENTAAEEAYVQAVLGICERESLDTVFPTWDPEVLPLSKNKGRLAQRGITVPVPEWTVLRRAMDKHALIRAASELGFACPRTYRPGAPEDAPELLDSARRRVGLGPAQEPSSSPRALLREYREPYRWPRRHFDWYFRALADDPLAALSWYASHLFGARRTHRLETVARIFQRDS